jgi:hypothetical protein
MGTDAETVRSKFKKLGGAEIGKFDQVQRRTDFIAKGQDVDEGFCRGACMDWIRRIVQGGHQSYGDARKQTQTLRMGRIQLAVEKPDLIADSPVKTVMSWLNGKAAWLDSKGPDKDKPETQVPTSVWEVLKRMTEKLPDPNSRKLTRAQCEDIYNIATTLSAGQKTTLNQGHELWKNVAPVMDQAMNEERKKWNEEGQSKYGKAQSSRPFSNLEVLATAPRVQYKSGADAIDQLLAVEEFQSTNTCLLAGFGMTDPKSKEGGHAVAVHRQNTGSFLLFDPKYGVYKYTSVDGLKNTLKFLFDNDYKVDGLGPIYGEDGWKLNHKVRYTVFGKKS